MTQWRSGDIVANGIRIHYTRTGGDGPPLVLVHGMADSGLCWSRVAHVLEAEYDLIMPDARSHGRSERSAWRAVKKDAAAGLEPAASLPILSDCHSIVCRQQGALSG